jgi:hypothetical protein
VAVKVEDTASDNLPAEISYKCLSCGEFAYFAYGKYEDNRFEFSIIPDCDVPIFGTEEESNTVMDREPPLPVRAAVGLLQDGKP